MLKNRYGIWNNGFKADHVNFWSPLSRFNNLLVIMNISMFFLTGYRGNGRSYPYDPDSPALVLLDIFWY